MKNKDRLHKVLDLKGLRIQPISRCLLEVKKATSKNKPGFIKCATEDAIANGLINGITDEDKGLVGFMIFVPKSEFIKMYEKEKCD